MNYFALVFIGLLLTYGCLCDQTAKENLVNSQSKPNSTQFKLNQNVANIAHQLNSTEVHSIRFINQTNLDLKPVSLNNLLDRIYKNDDLTANSTQFREMNVIDSRKDMQTAAGHKHHKVVEHHHHHHHTKWSSNLSKP